MAECEPSCVSRQLSILFLAPPPPAGTRGRIRTAIVLRRSMVLGRFRPGSGALSAFNCYFGLKRSGVNCAPKVWPSFWCVLNIHRARPYEFIVLGAIDFTKPCESIWSIDLHGPKPHEFIRFRQRLLRSHRLQPAANETHCSVVAPGPVLTHSIFLGHRYALWPFRFSGLTDSA